jgi:serine/threonine protein kinase
MQLTSVLDIKICDFGNASFVPEKESELGQLHINANVIPGSPTSNCSQMLTDGLGRGTPAYTAPEMLSMNQPYSFPVDLYSIGVILYTIISQREPFPNCSSPLHMLLAVKRGFFQSENQPIIMKWKSPDPADGAWQYPSGELVPPQYVSLVFDLVSLSPSSRPTAVQLVERLDNDH